MSEYIEYMILLAIIPLSCFEWTKSLGCKHRWMLRGITLGLVITPVSFAVAQFACVPVLGGLFGFIGQVTNLCHGLVGYLCLIGSGILEAEVELTATQLTMVNLVNGLLFAYAYGFLGHIIDARMWKKGIVRKVIFS
jgi:hypothetical protein